MPVSMQQGEQPLFPAATALGNVEPGILCGQLYKSKAGDNVFQLR